MNQHKRKKKMTANTLLKTTLLLLSALQAFGDDSELAKKLANPVAALISVPFQLNYDENIGSNDTGERWVLNIQPVIPLELNDEWNILSRTILPIVWQSDIYTGAGSQNGIGDIVQSLFLSPKTPSADGWIWGAGSVFLFPTASNQLLSAEKWGAGPTGVALKQEGPWTYGVLANHIWSFAGDDAREDVSATYLQPFLTYITTTYTSFALNTESTYDWEKEQWSIPVNATVSQVLKIGGQPLSIFAGVRYWADSFDSGAEGFGFRTGITLMFPKK